jgi:FkbM family methyltransferase
MILSNVRRRLTYGLAPWIRFLPPWWRWRVYSRLRGDPYQEDGFSNVMRNARIAPHGYEMELALDNWAERYAYFARSHYAQAIVMTVETLLRSGDWFLDIGANIGMLSLPAARAVGPTGRVLAFEPNVHLAERLGRSLERNRITNVDVFPVALGDANGSGSLDSGVQHVVGSLRSGVGATVPIRKGDDLLPPIPTSARVLAKIDVEGYEQRVLSGLGRLVSRPGTGFLIEITDSWLREMGGSAEELFDALKSRRYACFLAELNRRSRLSFKEIGGPLPRHQYDVLFVRPTDRWVPD